MSTDIIVFFQYGFGENCYVLVGINLCGFDAKMLGVQPIRAEFSLTRRCWEYLVAAIDMRQRIEKNTNFQHLASVPHPFEKCCHGAAC